MMLIKTRLDLVEKLKHRLKALHSYENPEFLVFVPESGSLPFLLWIDECLSKTAREEPPSL